MLALVAVLGILAVCWLSHSVGLRQGREAGRLEAATAKMLESGYGVDDALRAEPEDPTELFIADLDRRLKDEEWQKVRRATRRGQFRPIE